PLETQVDPRSPWLTPLRAAATEPTPVEPASLPPPAAPKLFVVSSEPAEPPAPWEDSRPWETATAPSPSPLAEDEDLGRETGPRPKVSHPSIVYVSCEPPLPALAPQLAIAPPVEAVPLVFDLRPRHRAWGRAIAIGVAAGLIALAIAIGVRRAPPAAVHSVPAPTVAAAPLAAQPAAPPLPATKP